MPNLTEFGVNFAELGPISVVSGPCRVGRERTTFGRFRANLARFRAKFGGFQAYYSRNLAILFVPGPFFCRVRSVSVSANFRPNRQISVGFGPILAVFRRCRAKSVQFRPNPARSRASQGSLFLLNEVRSHFLLPHLADMLMQRVLMIPSLRKTALDVTVQTQTEAHT